MDRYTCRRVFIQIKRDSHALLIIIHENENIMEESECIA
jgi:hypothetical protein